jgi:mono/diheme cytochrome c family protein
MKKVLKYAAIIVCIPLLLAVLTGSYVKLALPNIDVPQNIKVDVTEERVSRGYYLANHVAVCMDCHSTRDWSKFSGPPAQGETLGGGGELFGKDMGFPGNFYAANITPFSLSNWTDAEIFRAITSGVSKDGHALFPVMPYHAYGKLNKEDVIDIIAYLRTLPPVEKKSKTSEPAFPVNFIINTFPTEPKFIEKPSKNNTVAYGKYLVNMAGCMDCHSKREKGEIVPGSEFGGGMEFVQPAGIVRAPNITPDEQTGIGSWSVDLFVAKFKQYADSNYVVPTLDKGALNTPMPWTMYSGMRKEDLQAIYTYLKTLKPQKNEVVRYEHQKIAQNL